MKKIINGLRYDTEKAIKIGSHSYGFISDFSHWEATLYKTPKSGRFFLAGAGGPMSRYGRPSGNARIGGDGIDLMTNEEALAWAEQYLQPEEIETHFQIEEA